MRGWLFFRHFFYVLFPHRRERRRTPFCSPQYLVLIYIKNTRNLIKGELFEILKNLKLEGEKIAQTDRAEIKDFKMKQTENFAVNLVRLNEDFSVFLYSFNHKIITI